jgi:hypothetical protein
MSLLLWLHRHNDGVELTGASYAQSLILRSEYHEGKLIKFHLTENIMHSQLRQSSLTNQLLPILSCS